MHVKTLSVLVTDSPSTSLHSYFDFQKTIWKMHNKQSWRWNWLILFIFLLWVKNPILCSPSVQWQYYIVAPSEPPLLPLWDRIFSSAPITRQVAQVGSRQLEQQYAQRSPSHFLVACNNGRGRGGLTPGSEAPYRGSHLHCRAFWGVNSQRACCREFPYPLCSTVENGVRSQGERINSCAIIWGISVLIRSRCRCTGIGICFPLHCPYGL